MDPSAVTISATTEKGRPAIGCRCAPDLDVRRVTLSFNPDDEIDRERIGRVYRHGRVHEHEVRDGRVTIVADLPRRLLGWFHASAR
jgi:hypothetical protein